MNKAGEGKLANLIHAAKAMNEIKPAHKARKERRMNNLSRNLKLE